jgi:hypothetical protein
MKIKQRIQNRIIKQSKKGFRGYPVATVVYYGPDNQRASKVAVGIIEFEGANPVMRKWYTETTDARLDDKITNEIMEYIHSKSIITVAAVAKILGCPHEEEIDYPAGGNCPQCPYWADKDRWAGIAKEL